MRVALALTCLALLGCKRDDRDARVAPAPAMAPKVPISVGTPEPRAFVVFDPYECEPGRYLGTGLDNIGVAVFGPDGDHCQIVLSRLDASAPSRVELARCAIPRGAEMISIPWDLSPLELPGATCTHARVPLNDEPRPPPRTPERYWDPPDADTAKGDIPQSPRIELRYRVWKPSLHRPVLADLDRDDAVLKDRTVIVGGAARPSPFDVALRGDPGHAQTFRFSVPIPDAGDLANDVRDQPAGRYVAAEVEIVSVAPSMELPRTGPFELDVATCAAGVGSHRDLPMGSMNAAIVGPSEEDCVYDVSQEIEGGYAVRECHVPRATGVVKIFDGKATHEAGACVEKRHGNLLDDRAQQKWNPSMQAAIRGTRYVIEYVTLQPGTGDPLAVGDHVHVALRVWAPSAARPDLSSAPAAAPIVDGKQADVVVGEPSLGLALDAALRAPDLRHGGVRLYVVRTEVLGAFGPLLGATSLPPEQSVVVELTVP